MKSALLVIDVQQGLFNPPPAEAEQVLTRINQLSERARQAGVPVIFIQHQTAHEELSAGSAAWQIHQGLQVKPGDHRVDKTTPDSFLRTNLGKLLIAEGVTQLVICGYSTEYCVDTTTRRAAGLGYPVVLAADAHTSHDKPHASGLQIRAHHNATLSSIKSFGVAISAVPTAEVSF
ncbi:cysteine hydrolase [Serratia sp. JSRIV001]|uniref:cysteine hydrolase family protein n=1 Tax=Serratia TaxID=613 RepID=UPI0003AE87ED|nr:MULTISPECIES: cysteine hydrolase family protein [Serratia]ERK14835.1 Isochorismatase [Serratia fonticola AU-AP2C]MBP0999543.1 cysteine hydrolase [Serratia fonticola]MBP1004493.1 cysteine hydrolase [Serratia fonticola]MBP1014181.1 cysteine hydrolase [Serratia fonticola]MBP1020111.1 cysteine hydrolase [Serratia fonticola]